MVQKYDNMQRCHCEKKMQRLTVPLLVCLLLLLHVSYGLDTFGQVYTINGTDSPYYIFSGNDNSTTKLFTFVDQATLSFSLDNLTPAQVDAVSSIPKPDPSLFMFFSKRVNFLSQTRLWNETQSRAMMQIQWNNAVGANNIKPKSLVLYILNDTTNSWSSEFMNSVDTQRVITKYMDLRVFFNGSGFTFGVFGVPQVMNGTFGSSIVLNGPAGIYYSLRSELDQSLTVSVNYGTGSSTLSISKTSNVTMTMDSKYVALYGFTNYYSNQAQWTFSYPPNSIFKDYKGNTVQIIPSSITFFYKTSSSPIELAHTQNGNQVVCVIPGEGDVVIAAQFIAPVVSSPKPLPSGQLSKATNGAIKMWNGVGMCLIVALFQLLF